MPEVDPAANTEASWLYSFLFMLKKLEDLFMMSDETVACNSDRDVNDHMPPN